MILRESFAAIKPRTCAVGVLKAPVAEILANPTAPLFKVFGTGFLVGPQTILTCGHVVANVVTYIQKESLSNERRYVAFHRPDGKQVAMAFYRVEKMSMAVNRAFDVGLISFKTDLNDPICAVSAVAIAHALSCEVGDPVAVYGYAFAENLLKREIDQDEKTYRFGPILQQGYVSAISPYDHAVEIDRLLLDVRTARGMSGSPVFDPSSGTVIGVHDAGVEDTVAFAVPLNSDRISRLLITHASGSPGDSPSASFAPVSRVDRG